MQSPIYLDKLRIPEIPKLDVDSGRHTETESPVIKQRKEKVIIIEEIE